MWIEHRPVVAVVVLLVGLAQTARAQDREVHELTLQVGEQTSLSAEGVRQYSEGAQGIVDVRLPQDGSQFVLVGTKPGETTLLLIMESGKQALYRITVEPREPEVDRGRVEEVDNIRLDFYFVQLSDNYEHALGLGWPASIGGENFTAEAGFDLTRGFDVTSASAMIANQVLPRLDIGQSTGWARILRRGMLITANGNEANYESGGEVNVQIQGALTAEIRAIPFGSKVKVRPRYDRESGRVELRIDANVSDLTPSGGDVPGRTVSHLDTLVNLELGQAVVLAGLESQSDSGGKSGLPVLSQIPILGALFGSHTKRENRTQNVLFIVPTVVDAVGPDAKRMIDEALRTFDAYDGDMDDVQLAPESKLDGSAEGASQP
ncbi:MAG: pilus assembly protein N-terminal domain-containing protein [Myxococcota bacterium]